MTMLTSTLPPAPNTPSDPRALYSYLRLSHHIHRFVDELKAAATEAADREDSRGAVPAALGTALDYGKGVANYGKEVADRVGAAVSESPTVKRVAPTVQRVVASGRGLRRYFPRLRRIDSENRAAPSALPSGDGEGGGVVASSATSPRPPVFVARAWVQASGLVGAIATSGWKFAYRIYSLVWLSIWPWAPVSHTASSVSSMCPAVDKLRWRHRPLAFYALSHGLAHVFTPMQMRPRGFKLHSQGPLTYWHRSGRKAASSAAGGAAAGAATSAEAIVFIHGIGFGAFPYLEQVERMGAAIRGASLAESLDEVSISKIELHAHAYHMYMRAKVVCHL